MAVTSLKLSEQRTLGTKQVDMKSDVMKGLPKHYPQKYNKVNARNIRTIKLRSIKKWLTIPRIV